MANKLASCALVYQLTGSSLNFLFEEELSPYTNLQKNMFFGSLAGGMCKAHLGVIPIGVGGVLGASSIGGITLLMNHLNKKNILNYEMSF